MRMTEFLRQARRGSVRKSGSWVKYDFAASSAAASGVPPAEVTAAPGSSRNVDDPSVGLYESSRSYGRIRFWIEGTVAGQESHGTGMSGCSVEPLRYSQLGVLPLPPEAVPTWENIETLFTRGAAQSAQ